MKGQDALFSENMPLREVIVHFMKQLSAGTPTEENMGTPSWTSQDTSLETGQGEWGKPRYQRDVVCGLLLGYNFTELFYPPQEIKQMATTFITMTVLLVKAMQYLPCSLSMRRTVLTLKRTVFL